MTDIEKLVSFISDYDKGFSQGIRGAAPETIAALEAAAGQPLRTVYRNFLRTMGESMDWLRPAHAKFGAGDLLEYYRSQPWRAPTGYFKFGLGEDDPFFDFYLEARDVPQPRVITMPGGPAADFAALRKSFGTTVAGSLPEFLGKAAFRAMRMDRMPSAVRITGNEMKVQLLARVAPILEPLGFPAPLWFSNDWVQLFDAQDAAAIATQFPGTPLAIDLAASDGRRLDELKRAIATPLSLVHSFPVRQI